MRRARLSSPPAVRRLLPSTVTFLTCGRWLPLFENLSTLTTFGPGIAVFALGLLLRRRRAPEHQQLADVLDRRGAEARRRSSARSASRAARSSEKTRTLIRPWALSAASISRRTAAVSAVVADHDDRVEVMGVGALFLALGGGQEEGGHAPIIGAAMTDRGQEQEAEQGVAARPPQRPLRQAGAARGLSRARGLQAEGDRRGAAPARARASWWSTSARCRVPGASTCGASSAAARAASGGARPARWTARSSRSTCSTSSRSTASTSSQGDFREADGPGRARGTCRRPAGRRRPVGHGAEPVGHRRVRRGAHGAIWSSWRSISRGGTCAPQGALVCKVFHGSGYSQLVERFKASFPDRQTDQAEGVARRSRPRPFWSESASSRLHPGVDIPA